GSFFRREGRPSEGETLIARLIDRPIRPLFPEGFVNEVQVIATEDRETKTLIVEAIVRETGACNVQVIGKTLVLYRPTKERKISLPR
ncbi:hypothetical protein ACSLPA_08240, partial [Escherichia coli]